jgi:hypothetical protein
LLAIAAEGTRIPSTIPLYEESDIMSPVQDFLLTVWMDDEFQILKKVASGSGFLEWEYISVECDNGNFACESCDGRVTELTLQYNGTISPDPTIEVSQKKPSVTVFGPTTVSPGGQFSFSGADSRGTLGPEISVFVNSVLNTKFHTSCSQPIGPGTVKGDFEVIVTESRNGGNICPAETFHTDFTDKKQKECLERALNQYKNNVKKCFRKFKDDCIKLRGCLVAAADKFVQDIIDCGSQHDQGGGS